MNQVVHMRPSPLQGIGHLPRQWGGIAAAVLMTVAAASLWWSADVPLRQEIVSQRQTTARLEHRIALLEKEQSSPTDWSSIAAAVQPSVAMIEAGDATGSAWVAHVDAPDPTW
jgi:hypothetical protein